MNSSNGSEPAARLRASWVRGAALAGLLLSGRALAITSQDFQTPGGTSYQLSSCTGAPAPTVLTPGPGGTGSYLRLLQTTDLNTSNTVAFDRSDVGGFTQMTADFDFRIIPGTNRGEGFGFALLNTGTYGWTGSLCDRAEEPNMTKSLGIGFDVQGDGAAGEINNNHVSIHWDQSSTGGPVSVQQFDATPILDLASGKWIHATIIARAGGGNSDVSILLTPPGGTATSLVTQQSVPGLVPYETRAYFGARNSTNTAEYDIANVKIQYVADPAVLGQWSAVMPLPIVPVHSVLMPSGKIICWDRSGNGAYNSTPQLIDPVTWTVTPATNPGVQIFCGGMTLRHDGKLLVVGGNVTQNNVSQDNEGLNTAFLYDEGANAWTQLPNMNAGRWYPSLINLSNGDSLVLSGTYFATPGMSNTLAYALVPQVISGTTGTWRDLTGASSQQGLYPMLHLAPNGQVFRTGAESDTAYLDTSGTGTWTPAGNTNQAFRDYGNSVLYGPGKVIIIGGNVPPLNTAEIIDLTASPLIWNSTSSMSFARRMCSSVLLPDGTILTTGGSSAPTGFNSISDPVYAAELWDPTTGLWSMMSGAAEIRQYHSETILIPDGRVVSLGGGHPGPDHPDLTQGPDNYNAEIYSPPYLFKGARPVLSSAPPYVAYGQSFAVTSPDAASITDVTLLAPNAMTHAFDMNQRFLRPTWVAGPGSTTLTITAPSDPNLCPPGFYHLFILKSGVPSISKMIHIAPDQPPVAVATVSARVEATGPSGAPVFLDGTASSDLESPTLTYQWTEGATVLATTATATVPLSLGSHSITLAVTDIGGLTTTTTVTVLVSDTTPPVIQTISASPSLLRSVTDVLVGVTVSATATDAVTPSPALQISTITSSETDPPGDPGPDIVNTGPMTCQLRSERFTYVRVYTVTVSATDAAGNVGTASVPVRVRGKWFP